MLFRKQAIEAQRTRLYGQVLIATPIRFWVVTFFLVSTIVVIVVFLATASFQRIVKAPGAIVPTDGIVNVRAPQSGVISEFDLAEGDRVTQDQVIGRITSATVDNSDGTRIAAQVQRLTGRIENLKRRIEQANVVAALELQAVEQKRVEIESKITELEQLLVLQKDLLSEAEQSFERVSTLSQRDLVNADAMSAQTVHFINARQDVQRLLSEIAGLRVQHNQIPVQKEQSRAQAKLNQIQLESELAALVDEEAVLMSTQAFNIVAPASGRATTVMVSQGDGIGAAVSLFSILPEDNALRAELYLPSSAIGFVQPGQSVQLQLDAFPYQRFGAIEGTVSEVSGSVIMPGTGNLLVASDQPVYRVIVALSQEVINASGQEVPLQPGMLLAANIVLEDRTLLMWLIEPFIAVAQRS